MPIISVKDNKNNRWKRNAKKTKKQKKKQQQQKQNKGDQSYSERVRDKWFYWGFLQLTCKASLIFESNSELGLSVILKERELYESKYVAVECRCLNKWDLLSFSICSSILVLKWRQVSSI